MGEILPDGRIQGYACAACGKEGGFYGHYRNGAFTCATCPKCGGAPHDAYDCEAP